MVEVVKGDTARGFPELLEGQSETGAKEVTVVKTLQPLKKC